eukprot:154286_1
MPKYLTDYNYIDKFCKSIIKNTLNILNKNVAIEFKWSLQETAVGIKAMFEQYAKKYSNLDLHTILQGKTVIILPSHMKVTDEELLLGGVNRVNKGYLMLNEIDVCNKHLVNGYLREEQKTIFLKYETKTYFNLHSIAFVILIYSVRIIAVNCILSELYSDDEHKFQMKIDCNMTVLELKKKIEEQMLFEIYNLNALGTRLQDHQTIEHYNYKIGNFTMIRAIGKYQYVKRRLDMAKTIRRQIESINILDIDKVTAAVTISRAVKTTEFSTFIDVSKLKRSSPEMDEKEEKQYEHPNTRCVSLKHGKQCSIINRIIDAIIYYQSLDMNNVSHQEKLTTYVNE